MGKLDEAPGLGRAAAGDGTAGCPTAKLKLEQQAASEHRQMQRELADAITSLAALDDIRLLLAAGARVDEPVTQGLRPVHYAAYQNYLPAVRLLALRGCNINALDDNGYAPVHLAAERGYYELLKWLISHGAQVCFTKQRAQAFTVAADEPLSLALKRGHLDCAELLLKNGADPNARYFMGSEINLVSVLKVSSIRLLLEHGAQPDARDRCGLTPLMKAARHPLGYATVKLLVDYGADVNDIASEWNDYRTVLHYSIFSGNIDIIRLLLMSGARYPRLEFDKASPLDIAIVSDRHDIVKLLLEFDAELEAGAKTTIGQPLYTALSQPMENKHEIVRLLLEHGAGPNSRPTSSRNTGPPLVDYLNSVREHWHSHRYHHNHPHPYNNINLHHQQANHLNEAPRSHHYSSLHRSMQQQLLNQQLQQQQLPTPELDIIRLLLMYGARVELAKPAGAGLVRALERLQHDELSLDMLELLLDAAHHIDWLVMVKIIYTCLARGGAPTSATRSTAHERRPPAGPAALPLPPVLLDPSSLDEVTPATLARQLAAHRWPAARHSCLADRLVRRLAQQQHQPSSQAGTDQRAAEPEAWPDVLSLKQLSRIAIRRHLTDTLGVAGHDIVARLVRAPVPIVLRKYLLFQLVG